MSFKLLATLLILLLRLKSPEGHWLPHWPSPSGPNPLCTNQFALVNRACLLIPGIKPGLPTLPTLPSPEGGEAISVHHRRHRRHGHGHLRGHHELHQESPAEEECCRWLKEVDSMCACDLLVHLPPFLVKPVHSYTVVVDDACSVTFRCGPRK